VVLTGCYWGIEWEGSYWWVRGIGKELTAGGCIVGSCMVSGADWMLLGVEWEGRYWWVRGIGKVLTAGGCIVGSCMVSGADWMLLGD